MNFSRRVKPDFVRHEQAAVHAADGYAPCDRQGRSCAGDFRTGRDNTVTGIATAFMDSIPVIVLTGGSYAPHRECAFQEADIVGITRPAQSTITW